MSARQASLVVSDDLLFSLNGKFTIVGMYTGDIVVGPEGAQAAQLVFLFLVEGDLDDPIRSATLEVTLPGEEPKRMPMPILPTQPPMPDRTKWVLKLPFAITRPRLRPGRIEAKIIHEKGELPVTAPWIVAPAAPPAR